MKQIIPEELIRAGEIKFEFFRSQGPGGQNVNKVSTAVRVRFDVHRSRFLTGEEKERLRVLAGNRLTDEGILLIEATRFRTQERNRNDAIQRLMKLILRSGVKPKKRRPTKPTADSRKRRLEEKKRRSKIKRERAPIEFHRE